VVERVGRDARGAVDPDRVADAALRVGAREDFFAEAAVLGAVGGTQREVTWNITGR